MFLTEVFDVSPARLKDPQTEKPQHRDQGEVVGVAGLPGGGQHCLELQICQSKGWGLRGYVRTSDVLRRKVSEHLVDDTGAVETGHDGHPPAHG